DDVHFELNKLGREGGESFSVVAVESALDEDVLALDVPQLPEPLEESLPGAPAPRAVRRGTPEKAHPIEVPRLLRPSRERRSKSTRERGQQEAAAVHYSITRSARASSDGRMVRPQALAP